MTALLSLSGIEKSFGPVAVLRGVDFSVESGEVHALLGENGAGKSTLMRIVLGIEHADRGEMKLGGEAYRPEAPRDARARGVVIVPQERTLCPDLTVEENVLLGLEPVRRGLLDRRAGRALAEHAIRLVTGESKTIDLDAHARDLRVADQQLVEIARALAQGNVDGETGARARVLVLDEPTASLGHDDAAKLFDRVSALRAAGLAIVLVTHFLRDVRQHADRYTVLRDGKVQGSGEARTTPAEQIVAEMLGRDLKARRDEGPHPTAPAEDEPDEGDVLLEVRGLEGEDKPRSVSFALRRGEIFGIAGVVGSGRTETLRAILGLDPRRGGVVHVHAARGIGLLSEDRGGEGLMLDRSVAENVTLSPRGPLVSTPATILREGAGWIQRLGVRASGPAQRVGDLSGGNQQKVQVARLLREDYDVLLVDEPTRGIDVAAKAQILELFRGLARDGKAVVLVSSQLEELLTTCDRVAVLRGGTLGPARPVSSWTEESLLLEAAS